jgi:glucan 1,3-beta-glucosidase
LLTKHVDYTQLVGDAKRPPTILAAAGFNDFGELVDEIVCKNVLTSASAVIDADPYIPNGGGAQYWTNQNNFFRMYDR